MEHGGYEHGRERVFLLSTTHGGETHALAAAIANMRVYETEPVIEHLYRVGGRLKDGISEVIRRHDLQRYLSVEGRPCCLIYIARDGNGESSQAFRSLLLQETIKRGVIMPSLVVSYTHSDSDIDRTVDAWDGALKVYKMALEDGVHNYLVGRPSNPVFRRLR
jgi:glutamate-1-semialdehyde 2,1-aminomutase